ncbi:hypothetical protein SCUP234_00565 [Seiridium cupressi]
MSRAILAKAREALKQINDSIQDPALHNAIENLKAAYNEQAKSLSQDTPRRESLLKLREAQITIAEWVCTLQQIDKEKIPAVERQLVQWESTDLADLDGDDFLEMMKLLTDREIMQECNRRSAKALREVARMASILEKRERIKLSKASTLEELEKVRQKMAVDEYAEN